MLNKLATALVFLALLAAGWFALTLAGCTPMHKLDQALWGTDEQPAEPSPGSTPPILESIAAILATAGFGGMAAWTRRISRSANGRLSTLDAQLKLLTDQFHEARDSLDQQVREIGRRVFGPEDHPE